MLDYIARYGETPMAELPFGAVDNLIFAELSYCDFSNAAAQMPGRLSALRAHLAGGVKQPDDELLNRLSASARYGDVVAYHFVDHFDPVQTLQFAAVTLLLPDGTAYVSFRGTDSTLVGWKEDFNLAFATPVPAQLEAVRYLKQVADVLACPLRVGGHSKGGNLAVYAAAFVGEDVQERILNVFNNDGPGHDLATLESAGYRRIEKKLQTFIPKSSIIGMLLEHGDDYRIVDSDAHGLWQHNPYSWQLNGEDFVYLQHTTASSDRMNESIRQWLNHMDVEKRRRFTDTVYEVLSASEVRSVGQLISDFRSSLPSIIAATKNLDPEEKHMLAELATQFVRVASVQYGQLAREQLCTARAYMSALREKKVDVSAWLEKLREDKGE